MDVEYFKCLDLKLKITVIVNNVHFYHDWWRWSWWYFIIIMIII